MSPRRSSRARSAQNTSTPAHTNSSSAASLTKAPLDRNTRSANVNHNRTNSPGRASISRSGSLDDADSSSRSAHNADPGLPPRRSRRGNDNETKDKDGKLVPDEEEDLEEEAIEEDVTRCICGHAEYPGPGASVKEQFSSTEPLSDDVGNFFVQCDKCHVWQHGGCMGLTDESLLQDKDQYYCEQCKPEFHKIIKGSDGTKTSRYLPLDPSSNRSSPLSSEGPRKSNNGKKTFEQTKRRATMNSRVAYDEDEMLRRAIEESKETGALGKRSRDDVDDQKPFTKRQRTGSSVSSEPSRRSPSPNLPSDEPLSRVTSNGNGSKAQSKLRGVAAKNNREKELREKQKEQVAAQRAEAASKRNARSERRRADDSPPPSPDLSPSKPVQLTTSVVKSKAETPPSSKALLARKGGRPIARRGRLGRNQYTRDMPLNGDTSDSPMRDTSIDRHADSPRPHTGGNINGESGRSSKAKTHSARTSMNEMKRRVAAILEFVGRMQTERQPQAHEKPGSSNGRASRSSENASTKGGRTPNGANSTLDLPTASLIKAVTEGLEVADEKKRAAVTGMDDGSGALTESTDSANGVPILSIDTGGKEFDDMNSLEMMEMLTKDLVAWQGVYGIYAR